MIAEILHRLWCSMFHRGDWVRRPVRVRLRSGFADFDCHRCGAAWMGQRT